MELLAKLVQQAGGRITIMAGAGVRSNNIEALIDGTGITEFHTSARMVAPDPVTFRNPAILDATNWYIANEEELNKIMAILKNKTTQPG
jgi:copper homeostasis protein